MFLNKKFILSLSAFVVLNILLYLFINFFYSSYSIQKEYYYSSDHFYADPRATNGQYSFLKTLAPFDAQWYLKIASKGYPKNPGPPRLEHLNEMEGRSYAFFPLYPLTLRLFNLPFRNIELSALILSNLLMIAIFFSLYYVLTKIYSQTLALKTIFLIFLFPFSIFFRSYFSEGLQLLLLTWFTYFMIRKKLFASAISLSLLNIAKSGSIFLSAYFLFNLIKLAKEKKLSLVKFLALTFISVFCLVVWFYFCYRQTGNPFFFATAFSAWYPSKHVIWPLFNILTILVFPILPLHGFRFSKVDTSVMTMVPLILIKSKKFLKKEFWWVSFILWLTPLLTKDTSSFTRYQTVSFPLFIYLAKILKGRWYVVVLIVFTSLLFLTSLFFVNWYGIG